MNLKDIFNFSKLKPLIKFNQYKYIGPHDSCEGINYYIRKYDEHNNYELMEAKIEKLPKLFNSLVLSAGTNIKILDTFMMTYLKNRKQLLENPEMVGSDEFIRLGILMSGTHNEEYESLYSNKVPLELKIDTNFMKAKSDNYRVLYVLNTETEKRKFGKVQIVMVKEHTQKFAGSDLSYVCFKIMEYVIKPSYVKEGKKPKYMYFEHQPLNIPVSILK